MHLKTVTCASAIVVGVGLSIFTAGLGFAAAQPGGPPPCGPQSGNCQGPGGPGGGGPGGAPPQQQGDRGGPGGPPPEQQGGPGGPGGPNGGGGQAASMDPAGPNGADPVDRTTTDQWA